MHGHIKMYVIGWPFCWTTFLYDLAPSCIDKELGILWALLVLLWFADLFLFCYERDFMVSLSDDNQADVIDAFNTTSRYLDDILNINNVFFWQYGKSNIPFRAPT